MADDIYSSWGSSVRDDYRTLEDEPEDPPEDYNPEERSRL